MIKEEKVITESVWKGIWNVLFSVNGMDHGWIGQIKEECGLFFGQLNAPGLADGGPFDSLEESARWVSKQWKMRPIPINERPWGFSSASLKSSKIGGR